MAASKPEPAGPATLEKPSKPEVIKVHVEKVFVQEPEVGERDRYWIGLIDSCPYDHVGIAGITFHKFTDPPRFKPDGEQYRPVYRGTIVSLSAKELETMKKKIVMRWVQGMREREGKMLGGFIRSTDTIGFSPGVGDIPLAKFLFMQRLGPQENPSRDGSGPCPETMA